MSSKRRIGIGIALAMIFISGLVLVLIASLGNRISAEPTQAGDIDKDDENISNVLPNESTRIPITEITAIAVLILAALDLVLKYLVHPKNDH